jgi:hypothetical protein
VAFGQGQHSLRRQMVHASDIKARGALRPIAKKEVGVILTRGES